MIRVPVCARAPRVCPVSVPAPPVCLFTFVSFTFLLHDEVKSSQVKSIHKQQTTIRKPIECAPVASRGGREWAEMTEGVHLEVTRHKC